MSSVQIRDVRKSFGGFEVLHGVSSGDPYRARLATARMRRMTGSDLAGAATAALYIGSEADVEAVAEGGTR